MANVIELIAKLRDEASGGLEKLGTSLRKIADVGLEPIARLSPTAANALGGLLDKAGPTGLAVGAIGGAAVGAVAGLAKMAASAGENIERLDNLSTSTGLSVAVLQALERAATEAGRSGDELIRPMISLNAAIAEVNKGNFDVDKSFQQVGVSLVDLVGAGKSTEEILQVLAQRWNAIQDPQAKAAAAADLFGVRGQALTAVLKEIAETGLPAYIEKMRKAGVVTDESMNEAARAIDKMSDEAGRSIEGVKNQVVGGLTVMAANVIDLFKRMGSEGPAALFQPSFIDRELAKIAERTKAGLLKGLEDAAKGNEEIARRLASQVGAVEAATVASHEQAAAKIAVIQATLTGDRLRGLDLELQGVIKGAEAERDAKLQALESSKEHTSIIEARRAAIIQETNDRIILGHVQSAEKRKAIEQGLVSELKAIFESLGAGFADVVKKLTIAEAVEKAGADFRKLDEAAKLNAISARDAAGAVGEIVSNLEKMGATGQQIGAAVPENIRAIADGFDAVANKAVLVNGVFTNVVSGLQQVEAAAERLDDELTGHSLDQSFVEVSEATQGWAQTLDEAIIPARESVEWWDQMQASMIGLGDQSNALKQRWVDLTDRQFALIDGLQDWTRSAADAGAPTEELGRRVAGAGESVGPAGFKFENLKKAVERYTGSVPAAVGASRDLGSAMDGVGGSAAGTISAIAALVSTMSFSGKTFQELAANEQKVIDELFGKAQRFEESLARIRAGAENLRKLGGGLGGPQNGGPTPQFFQHGGIVQGPPGRHVPILAEAGEGILPRKVMERFRRPHAGRTFQEGGIVSGAGAGITINVNVAGGVPLETTRQREALARDLGHRIRDQLRRGTF